MSTFDHVPYASGEPTRDPTYPIPPPGEYYATVRWVKELVDSTISSVDPDNVHQILNNLLAAWDPSNAMQKIPGASENVIPKFNSSGQVMPSNLSLTELIRLRDEVQSAIQSIESKVDKAEGKGLSTCDFTEDLRQKLDGINPDALTLDKSLSREGRAADALAVGQVTRQNREYIEALQALLKAEDGSYTNVGSRITELTQDFNDLHSSVSSISSGVDAVTTKLTSITDGLADTDTIKSLHESLCDDLAKLGTALSSKVTNEDVVTILNEYMGGDGESGSASVANRIAALERGKVDTTAFDELQTQVEGKANNTQVEQLTKSVNELAAVVGGKVATSDYELFKTDVENRLGIIESIISGMAEITQKRGKLDLDVYDTDGDELVATGDTLATKKGLDQCRKIDDLGVSIVVRDENGNEVNETTTLVTKKDLEDYLNNNYDSAERTYYG